MPEDLRIAKDSQVQLIVIAIDNNDQAWYEMVIPFILSLRQTDWSGRFGIIGYGLSDQKLAILQAQGIAVYPPAGTGFLACDRYLAAAEIIKADASLKALALYDADVWFPDRHFDLFDQLVDETRVHVAPDAHFCDFISAPIMPHATEVIRQCCAEVIEKFGCAFQAGLVMGGRDAWERFARHTRSVMEQVGTNYTLTYGLDSTLLHLWAAMGGVHPIAREYNFVPKWGIHDHHDLSSWERKLQYAGKPIKALHMIGESRYCNAWRYLARNSVHAMQAGQAFCLVPNAGAKHCADSLPDAVTLRHYFDPLGLEVSAIRLGPEEGGCRLSLGTSMLATTVGTAIFARINRTLEVDLVAREAATLQLVGTFVDNQPSVVRCEIALDGGVALSNAPSFNCSVWVQPGTHLCLRAVVLPGQRGQIIWDISRT